MCVCVYIETEIPGCNRQQEYVVFNRDDNDRTHIRQRLVRQQQPKTLNFVYELLTSMRIVCPFQAVIWLLVGPHLFISLSVDAFVSMIIETEYV